MTPRTILVTGPRGIGHAIAACLAHSGWRMCGGVPTDVAAKELATASDLTNSGAAAAPTAASRTPNCDRS